MSDDIVVCNAIGQSLMLVNNSETSLIGSCSLDNDNKDDQFVSYSNDQPFNVQFHLISSAACDEVPESLKFGEVNAEVDFDDDSTIYCAAGPSRFLPQLVFYDSDDNIASKNSCSGINQVTNNEPEFCRPIRSVSDGVLIENDIAAGYKLNPQPSPEYILNSERQHCQFKTSLSLHSSDSELITDHSITMLSEHQEEYFDRFVLDNSEDHSQNNWHCHVIKSKVSADKVARNKLIAVSILCLLFMVGEAIGGAISHSLALFTDVLHLGSDLISFLISLLAIYLSKKPASRNMSFGYHRAEVLGALVSVFIMWLVTGILVYMAVERIIHVHYKDVLATEMLLTAAMGVVFNIVMGLVLHYDVCCGRSSSQAHFGHGHSHGHFHSNHHHSHETNESERSNSESTLGSNIDSSLQPLMSNEEEILQCTKENDVENQCETTVKKVKPHLKNINVRAAFIHVLGDIIQSLGVLIAAIIIKLRPEEKYRLADPICTFLFSILVLLTTINVLKDTLRIIMEGVPPDINYYLIKTSLQKIPGVKAVHGLNVWSLTIQKNALAVHLAIDCMANHEQVLFQASELLQKNYNFLHTTIQVEVYKPHLMEQCSNCQELHK